MTTPDANSSAPPVSPQSAELVTLIMQHQQRIMRYLFTLVPRYDVVEDLFQDTVKVICEKFSSYQPGTDFAAWACQIAYWEVRQARQRYARCRVIANQDVIDAISVAAVANDATQSDNRHEALSRCLEQLPARDRTTILARYEDGGSVERAAALSSRTTLATYKALTRLRKSLHQCIEQRITVTP